MDKREKKQEIAAEVLLEKTGLSLLDMARIVLELSEELPEELRSLTPSICRRVFRLGLEALRKEDHTVTFREAVEKSLLSRADRRPRTISEINQFCRRLVRQNPNLAEMPMRGISSDMCRSLIMNTYYTPSTRRKARRLLHAVFAFSLRHGWCAANPVQAVDVPSVCEKTVHVLTMDEIRRLLTTVRRPEHRPCAPAIGFMLWAGIRPTEITRLRWKDIHLDDKTITLEPEHTKTGGARQVTLHPVLIKWLQETARFRLADAHIIPASWVRRWHALRVAAGFDTWHPDALRHTYASYHLKYFRNLPQLQLEMGHANIQLLRTRYLGMRGLTRHLAEEFWGSPGRGPRRDKPEDGSTYL